MRSAAPLVAALFTVAIPSPAQKGVAFRCDAGKGAQRLQQEIRYQAGAAAGWDLTASPTSYAQGSCSADTPFFFSVDEPDGTYRVTLRLGGPSAANTTVRAESRRLMTWNVAVPAKGTREVVFNVHLRSAPIAGTDEEVHLKPREIGALDWDNKLTLEFNGDHSSVRSIEITPVHVPTVYLAGDSTVVDQDKEPWAAWGQMLPLFFDDHVAVANEAESGETIKAFVSERRRAKIMSTIQPGDFLMIQFAHNDQKPGRGFVSIDEYKSLLRSYVVQARAKGATAIFVTSMNRRTFDDAGHIRETLGDYPQAMRDVAAEDSIALIDLNRMSRTLYEAMGPEGTLKAFVHYPAHTFPDQQDELKDDTHFNSFGAYELARCVVQSMRDQRLPLARFLLDGPSFDPAHPDTPASVNIPTSPFLSTQIPYGR